MLAVMAFERFDTKSTDLQKRKFYQRFSKLKEVFATARAKKNTTFNFSPTLPSPPTTHSFLKLISYQKQI